MQTAKRWQLWTPRAHSSQSGKKYVVQKDKNLPARKRVVTKTAFKTKYIIFTDYFIMKLWIMFFTNLEMMEKNVFTNFESLGPFVLRIQSSCHLCLCHLQTRLLQLFKSSLRAVHISTCVRSILFEKFYHMFQRKSQNEAISLISI